MKAVFLHNNHEIVVDKRLSGIQLFVDDQLCAEEKEFFKVQNTDYDLIGVAKNADGSHDEVKIAFKHGMFKDEVTLFYSGKEIDTKSIL